MVLLDEKKKKKYIYSSVSHACTGNYGNVISLGREFKGQYLIGRAGASPPSRTAAIIFLYIYIFIYIYLYPSDRFGPRVAPRYAQT